MISPDELSIVVTAQDIESYIVDCLASIDATGGRDCELIVVDDGSSDGTLGLVEGCLAARANGRLVKTDHVGPGGARNAGIAASTRPYIMFVDGDDLLVDDAVTKLLARMSPDIDILFSNRAMYFEADGRVRRVPGFRDKGPVPVSEMKECIGSTVIHGRVFRRGFLDRDRIRFEEDMFWEDIVFLQQCYALAGEVASLADVTYWWRKRSQATPSITQRNHTAFSIRSRMRQLERSHAIFASEGWVSRFGRGRDDLGVQIGRAMVRHMQDLSEAAPRGADEERALDLLIEFTSPHSEAIRRGCPSLVVACYENLWARDIDRLAANMARYKSARFQQKTAEREKRRREKLSRRAVPA